MRVYVKSYHAGLDAGGGVFVFDSGKSSINDGGVIFNGWCRQDLQHASPEMFGAKGDGTTDDSNAFQKMLDSFGSDRDNLYTYKSAVCRPAIYYIAKQINVSSFLVLYGNNCILKGAKNGRIFSGITWAYQWYFDKVKFVGDNVEAVFIDANNLDAAKFVFQDCQFGTTTRTIDRYAIYVKSRSAHVYLHNCDAIDSPNYLKTYETDFCRIKDGWVNGYCGYNDAHDLIGTKPADSCSIYNGSRQMEVDGTIFVPEHDSSGVRDNVRWFDNYGSLSLKSCHFGGENSGFPIIYQYVTAVTTTYPFANYASILVEDCQISGGLNHKDKGVIVLMPNVVAGRYSFINNNYANYVPLINSIGYDFSKTRAETDVLLRNAVHALDFVTLQTQIEIFVVGTSPTNEPDIPNCLKPFVRTKRHLGSYVAAPKATPIKIAKLMRSAAPQPNFHSSVTYEVSIQASMTSDGILSLYKKYIVEIAMMAGNPPFIRITKADYKEYALAEVEKGDTIIDLAVASDGTVFDTALQVTVNSTLSLCGLAWSVKKITAMATDTDWETDTNLIVLSY